MDIDQIQPRPYSWTDAEGTEWCRGCHQQIVYYDEGWICSSDCRFFVGPAEPDQVVRGGSGDV